MWTWRGAFLVLLLCMPSAVRADAEVWATCGPIEGVSHIVQGDGVNRVETGGHLADIAGDIVLVHDAGRAEMPFDVVHQDQGEATSLIGTEAQIAAVETDDGGVLLAAVWTNGVVETFRFEDAALVYTQTRPDGDQTVTSGYLASCRWLR